VVSVPFNDLSRSSAADHDSLLNLYSEVLRSGWFLNGGFARDLKQALSARIENRPVTLVGNGTDALRLALTTLGVGPGRRVATVGNAGGYSSGATLSLGAIPVIVDVDESTAQMDPGSLALVVESAQPPDVIVVTHLYGQMAPILRIMDLASSANIPVIEDVAQAFGASIPEGPAGSFGSLATTSFYPTKNLASIGDAGAVFSATDELASRCARFAQYGWGERYVVESVGGFNSRMDEIHAATVLHRLERVTTDTARRRSIASAYRAVLDPSRTVIGTNDESFAAHLAVMTTDSREEDSARLRASGIDTSIHYPLPDHWQPAWRELVETPVSLDATEKLTRRILSLPCFSTMSDAEVAHVTETLAVL
jgi:dTDP-4-amino-4,6-dideoxygalactose transaminase